MPYTAIKTLSKTEVLIAETYNPERFLYEFCPQTGPKWAYDIYTKVRPNGRKIIFLFFGHPVDIFTEKIRKPSYLIPVALL